MFKFLQITALLAIALVVTNETEAKSRGTASKGTGMKSSPGKTGTKSPAKGQGKTGTGKHDPKGISSKGHPTRTHSRDFRNWGHRYFNSRYGCEYCWSSVYSCYFYFYAPAGCYYPVTYIAQYPPVQASIPVSTPVVATAQVLPAIQITNVNRNTLINGATAAVPVVPAPMAPPVP